MARKWRVRYAGARYHVTARGDGRREIFLQEEDGERFLRQLDHALEADDVTLFAYVLMPNHYHLFVQTPLGNISRFMQRLNSAYAMYFRYKRHRPGHCFQGRYGARLVGGDGYALRLTRYIHLNPVWTKAAQSQSVAHRVRVLSQFAWSSYRGYAGLAAGEERLDYRLLEAMNRATDSGRRAAYQRYAESMAGTEDEIIRDAMDRSPYALGDERFVEETEAELKEARLRRAIQGDVVWPVPKRPLLTAAIRQVCKQLNVSPDTLKRDGRMLGPTKGLALEAICQLSQASQRAVAQALGMPNELTVGHHRRLLARRMEQHEPLRQQLDQLLAASP